MPIDQTTEVDPIRMLEAFDRARTDLVQDGCENSPFNCIGGLDRRANPLVPWIAKEGVALALAAGALLGWAVRGVL